MEVGSGELGVPERHGVGRSLMCGIRPSGPLPRRNSGLQFELSALR
jgi:hypothetical protein